MSRRYPLSIFLACVFILTLLSAALAQSTTPSAPEGLFASTNESSIYLTWNPPTDQGNSSIIAYLIYKGEDPGSIGFITETDSTSYEDFDIDVGTTYFYQVSARNEDGEGPRSNEVSVILTRPSYTLSGRVADKESEEGIVGARLEFQRQDAGQQQFETRTDGSGSYSIELEEGNYQVRIEADEYDTIEDHVFMNDHQTMDFEFEEEGGGGSEDFNLSDILGIDEDKVERYVLTAAIIAGAVFSIVPLTMIILLIMVFYRMGKVRKELRARNEQDGIFISKRRKRKHEERTKKTDANKGTPPASENKKKKIEIEEEEEEED